MLCRTDIELLRTMSYTIWVKRTTSYLKWLFLPFWRATSYVTSYTISYVKRTMSYTMCLKRTTSYVGGLFLPFWRTTSYTTSYVFNFLYYVVYDVKSHHMSMLLLYDVIYDANTTSLLYDVAFYNDLYVRHRIAYNVTYDKACLALLEQAPCLTAPVAWS